MINLLPKEVQNQHAFSSRNRTLRNYLFITAGMLVVTTLLILATWQLITTTKANAETENQDNLTNINNYTKDKAEADAFAANLARAKTILDQRFLYSKVLFKISQALPNNVSLDSIQLNQDFFDGPKNLTLHMASINDAVATKVSFENSDLFEQVIIASITESTDSEAKPNEKISAVISVVLKREKLDE